MLTLPDSVDIGTPVVSKSCKSKKQRDKENVKALDSGYFLKPTRYFLESNFLRQKHKDQTGEVQIPKNCEELMLLKLMSSWLRSVGDIGICVRLTILKLNNNFISRIDSLAPCINLIKLDLHSNQIVTLPEAAFWQRLWKLKILHLHDNPIGNKDNLRNLGHSPSISLLTLYDTPISLRKNYRHHVVNSLWSLKALDLYIISDEEIIEDAHFGGIFQAFSPNFKIDLCPPFSESASLAEEMHLVNALASRVNSTLAHCSPVLIIQRYIRGYFIRQRLNLVDRLKSWASQVPKKYLDWEGHDTPRVNVPPPPSPSMATSDTDVVQTQPAMKPGSAPTSRQKQGQEELKLDYDTYMKNRRPGSTGVSEASLSSRQDSKMRIRVPPESAIEVPRTTASIDTTLPDSSSAERTQQHDSDDTSQVKPVINVTSHSVPSEATKSNIFIDLVKLHATTMESLQDKHEAVESHLGSEVASPQEREKKRAVKRSSTKKPKDFQTKKKPMRTVKEFFGPIVQTSQSVDPSADSEEVPWVDFRLSGFRHQIRYYDPTTDMIIARQEAAIFVRDAEQDHHERKEKEPPPEKYAPRPQKDKRPKPSMALSCLTAVKRAYKDRDKAERCAARLEAVLSMKNHRDAAKHRISLYHNERRNRVIQDKELEQKKLVGIIDKREQQMTGYLSRNRAFREKSNSWIAERREENSFVVDFSTQNTSVSKALQRHDREAQHDDRAMEINEQVQGSRSGKAEQSSVVKSYLEHRQLLRQTQTSLGRAAIDARKLQEANERLCDARQRVAQQKARQAQVQQAVYTAVKSHSLPPVHPEAETAMKGLDRWSTAVFLNQGRVGKHPVYT